jgi:hypothetical protein
MRKAQNNDLIEGKWRYYIAKRGVNEVTDEQHQHYFFIFHLTYSLL